MGFSLSSFTKTQVVSALSNGILANTDNYFTHGLPRSSFSLPLGPDLHTIFSQHRESDPFKLAHNDITRVSDHMMEVVASDHSVIRAIATHFFHNTGKFFRPTILVLMSRALSETHEISDRQLHLAEITELIHTASLLHDDVIDESHTRRGTQSVHSVYGNKLAILGGDYLLSRASVMLARLRNFEVTESMSTTIEHLVKGEIMQLKPSSLAVDTDAQLAARVNNYVCKSYYKTASLISNSCRSTALLEGCEEEAVKIATSFGSDVGLAFQLVDDILDFEGKASALGKPTFNDLKQGMATLPVLLAVAEFPELGAMIERKFKQKGDVEQAIEFVYKSGSLEQSKALAEEYASNAVAALLQLPSSDSRSGFINLVERVTTRSS